MATNLLPTAPARRQVDNRLAWVIAAAPLLCLAIRFMLARAFHAPIYQFILFDYGFMIVLCTFDEAILRDAGVSTRRLWLCWWFLVPLYLLVRARRVGGGYLLVAIWLASALLVFILSVLSLILQSAPTQGTLAAAFSPVA